MTKYINADALIADLQDRYKSYSWDDEPEQKQEVAHWVSWIDNLEAVDVRENVRGEWEWRYDDENGRPVYGCSFCNEMIVYAENKGYVFCPYCGADMGGKRT